MNTLVCPACETTYQTATTGARLERLAQLGCEACGGAEPLRPVVRAVSERVNVPLEESEDHAAGAAPFGT